MLFYRCDLCGQVKECLQREIDHKEFKSLTSSLSPCVFRHGIEVIRLSLGSRNVTTEQGVALMQASNEPQRTASSTRDVLTLFPASFLALYFALVVIRYLAPRFACSPISRIWRWSQVSSGLDGGCRLAEGRSQSPVLD